MSNAQESDTLERRKYSDLDSMSGFRECGYLGSQEKMVQPAKLVVGG
ncbi:hypothetical protein T23_03680 [Turicibacter faecis]|jgi:hypothetical protein|uniref:Uncharacterized protein n=1 Tax=Turicibacter faecis TaxID=2963365 RepID=A0ABM8IG86_9FIRM|nr:hypothetical protein T23_03680 [Turicibacter sp. TC023]